MESTEINSPWSFTNAGSVQANAANLFFSSFTQTAGSLVLAGGSVSSSAIMQIQGGSVAGNGTITASVTNSGGTLSPGASPGLITIDGNYVQTDGTPPSGN